MVNNSRIEELVDDAKALGRCLRFVWKNKLTYIIYVVVGAVLSLIISFSIPKTYSASVVLAPEPQSGGLASGFSGLASLAGINMTDMNNDAYTIDLYPSIVSSTDFVLSLSDIRIKSSNLGIDTTYAYYLKKYVKKPWWGQAMSWMMSFIPKGSKGVISSGSQDGNVRVLTEEQYNLNGRIMDNVRCSVESLTGVISITVFDQDPEICALVADSVVSRLSRFIHRYRTAKARKEYEYLSTLCDSTRSTYLLAQEKYVDFTRSHINISSPSHKAEEEFLQNEVNLAYTAYSNMVAQVQMAGAKIMETTPLYTTIDSAYVPLKADSPKKLIMLVVFVFMACIIATAKLVYVQFLGKRNDNHE